jgi:hypothetical protein
MKKSLLSGSLFLLGLLYSCKKDGSDFKLYTGSPGGGTEVSKDYTPESIWGIG